MAKGERVEEDEGSDPRIFFSYSRKDLDRARPIIDFLEAHGFPVWWDGKLEAGVKYIEKTEHALDSAAAVVVAWSEQSTGSHWVRDEATSGRDSNRLVPLSLDGSLPPLGFRQFQVLDFSHWTGNPDANEAQELLKAVRALGNWSGTHSQVEPSKIAAPGTTRRNSFLYFGIGAGALAAGGAAYGIWRGMGSEVAAQNSIAVLPFSNDSDDQGQEYLTAGVATELRSRLARNPALKIVARSSSEAIARQGLDAVSAARALGVTFIVEGSARLIDGVVRVSSDLIDGETGLGRWSQTFSRPFDGLLELQRDLAVEISNALSLEVSKVDAGLKLGEAQVPAAYAEYLRGWSALVESSDGETRLEALRHFQTAARLDPQFAGARAGEAVAFLNLGHSARDASETDRNYASAADAARMAIELGPDLAEAHSVYGQVLFDAQLKIAEAREPLERALELGPGVASNQLRFAEYSALTGKSDAARKAAEIALDLDPFNPGAFKTAALVDYAGRRFEKSMEKQFRALELAPEISGSHFWIASSLHQLGRAADAVSHCEAEPSLLFKSTCSAIVQKALGNDAPAQEAMTILQTRYGEAGAYQQAQVLAQWGEPEAAIEQLAIAQQMGDAGLTYLRMDPMLDPLRQRPDFIRLQSALGFR